MGASSNFRRSIGQSTMQWSPANSRDFTNSYVEIPHMGLYLPSGSVTVEFWAYFTTLRPNYAFANASQGSGTNRFSSHAPWEDGTLYWDHGNITTPNSQARLQIEGVNGYMNQWVHFEVRISQAEGARSIHVRGDRLQYYGGYDTYTPTDESLFIGGIPSGLNYPGRLGEMRIWTTDRSYDEMRYNADRVVTGPEPGLLACWRLDDQVPVGGRILDRSGNNFHGILH